MSALLLYGTEEPVAPPRVLRAGPLSAELEAGNLRYIRYAGFEMIRAISFLVRGRAWNTFAAEIADLTVREDGDAFRVRYTATIGDGAATLTYRARIDGTANGALSFSAEGMADADFVTCRAGFVVLHPIVGVASHAVEIEHVDGRVVEGKFPALIDPVQPMRDLRALTHRFAPGARVTCRMEGDTFEMEDQRNWTDASYKTYVRPLALPWPYTLAASERLRQSVTLRLHGRPTNTAAADDVVRINIGGAVGKMPPIALGCTPAEAAAALPHAKLLSETSIAGLVVRLDPCDGFDAAALKPVQELAEALTAEVELQLVALSLENFAAEIAAAAGQVKQASLDATAVAVTPAADLKSTPPGSAWPPCPPAADVLAATRAAFPGLRLGGGMLSTFTELNRKRPPLDLIDYVTFCTTPNVHAGDDRSVMETLESLPFVAASARAIAGEKPFVVGPSTIGMRDNPYGTAALPNPDSVRVAMAGRDPRQAGLFNAAWTLGYIARFTAGGAARVALSAPTGDFGILSADGTPYPVFHVIQNCSRMRGWTLHAATTSREHDVLALYATQDKQRTLLLANLTAEPIRVAVPEAMRGAAVAMLDTASPDRPQARASAPAADLTLQPYAVAILSAG
jgi:D-apionolactonase